MHFSGTAGSHEGNKKVGKFYFSDFGALADQQIFTVQ
jgi:hypothetical protein